MTAKRVDDNQREIVSYLRKAGASVLILSDVGKGCPDILIGITMNDGSKRNFLAELKNGKMPPSGQRLTTLEHHFHETWKGQVMILNSVGQAQAFIRGIRQPGFD